MFCIFFSIHGFLVNKTLPNGQRFNSEFMVNCILPELSDKMFQFRKKNGPEEMYVHMDNAPSHNSRMTSKKMTQFEMKKLDHPSFSPDVSPCDFWLFSKTKNRLKGKTFSTENELFEAVDDFLKKITKDEIKSVYQEWIRRLHMVIDYEGEYVIKKN